MELIRVLSWHICSFPIKKLKLVSCLQVLSKLLHHGRSQDMPDRKFRKIRKNILAICFSVTSLICASILLNFEDIYMNTQI